MPSGIKHNEDGSEQKSWLFEYYATLYQTPLAMSWSRHKKRNAMVYHVKEVPECFAKSPALSRCSGPKDKGSS